MLTLLLVSCVTDPKLPADDTGTPTDPGYTEVQVDSPSAEVDPDVEALVWVRWNQLAPAQSWVEARVGGGEWRPTPARAREAGPASQLVAGFPYGSALELRVVNDFGAGPLATEPLAFTSGPLPENVPQVGSVEGDATAWDPDTSYVLLSLADGDFGAWVFIIDRAGDVVWARESPRSRLSLHARVSLDGADLLVDDASYWSSFDGGASSEVLRMKLDGTVVETMATPGLHHPFTDLPDGSLLYGAYTGTNDRSETLDRRWPDGTVETAWDCEELIDAVGDDGYCGSNTVWYDPATGRVLYSLYSVETIVDLDLERAEPVRWFGHLAGSWGFDPPETAFWWQHGGNFTSTGTLLTSSKGEDSARETVIREYRVDEATETLVEVWSFGEGEGIYGDVMGEAHRLANGNTLHNYGSASRIREVTPDGQVVWDVNWRADTMGRSTPIGDLYAFVDPAIDGP